MAKYGLVWELSTREEMLQDFTHTVSSLPECDLTSVNRGDERMFYRDKTPVYIVVQDHGLERVYKVVGK